MDVRCESTLGMCKGRLVTFCSLLGGTHAAEMTFHLVNNLNVKRYIEVDTDRSLVAVLK